jgi:S1-C subfamily serine protease
MAAAPFSGNPASCRSSANTGDRVTRIIIRHLTGSKAHRVEEFPLDTVSELTIGRDPASTITFDPERDDVVSRRHARIRVNRGGRITFTIVDEDSRNGTLVRGVAVTGETALQPGDEVQLGANGPRWVFDVEPRSADQSARPPEKPGRTSFIARAFGPAGGLGTEPEAGPGVGPGIGPGTDPGASRGTGLESGSEIGLTAGAERAPGGGLKADIQRATGKPQVRQGRRRATRWWMYGTAAVLAAAVVIGALLLQQGRTTAETLTAAVEPAPETEQEPAGRDQAREPAGQAGLMTSQQIAEAYDDAAVQVSTQWELFDSERGRPLYHKFITVGNDSRPAYILMPDRRVVRWIMTHDENQTNERVGRTVSGSGFAVSRDGLILTSKRVAADWLTPYGLAPYEERNTAAWLYVVDWQGTVARSWQRVSSDVRSFRDDIVGWVPGASGFLFRQKSPALLYPEEIRFEARSSGISVRLAGDAQGVEGRLVGASARAAAALISIDTPRRFTAVELARHDHRPAVGESVTVIGYPAAPSAIPAAAGAGQPDPRRMARAEPVVTEGTVASIGGPPPAQAAGPAGAAIKNIPGDAYRVTVDATVPGQNGAPVFDSRGRVIGLFTDAADPGRGGFAIPIRHWRDLLQSRRAGE